MKWTSVKDKLPDKDGEYLAVLRFSTAYYSFIHIVDFSTSINAFIYNSIERTSPGNYEDYSFPCESVTHWMPLPELPKEDGERNER